MYVNVSVDHSMKQCAQKCPGNLVQKDQSCVAPSRRNLSAEVAPPVVIGVALIVLLIVLLCLKKKRDQKKQEEILKQKEAEKQQVIEVVAEVAEVGLEGQIPLPAIEGEKEVEVDGKDGEK